MAHIPPITPEQLRALRREQELTQQEFAKVLNYSPRSVRRWESGEKLHKATRMAILSYAKQMQSQVMRWE